MKHITDKNLIKTLGLDNLPPADQEKLLLQIGDCIYEAIIARTLKAMTPTDKVELEHLLAENPSFEIIGEFIYSRVPNIDTIAEEEINTFKKIALDTIQVAVAA
jgi:hypothetical protein